MLLNFKKLGETGPALLILHGVFGSLDNWLTIGKHLADSGYSVYLLDQRNHGRSPHADALTYEAMADDLETLIVSQHIVSPILVGHSMGGKTVMQYALTRQSGFEKLVVVDISPRAYPVHHTRLLAGLNHIDLHSLQSRQQADELLAVYEDAPGVRQFLLKNLYRKENGSFGWRFNLPVLTRDMPLIGNAVTAGQPVTTPALFMRGANSDYVTDKDWADIQTLFPHAVLETIPDAGHWVQADQPKAFLSTLLAFLQHGDVPF